MPSLRDLLLGTKRRRAFTLLAITGVFCLFILELACQALGFVQLAGLARARKDPQHYYQASGDPTLVYELKRSFALDVDGRKLRINAAGFREESDERFDDRRRVAIVGDSVVFGIGLSQEQTISAALQQRVDPAGEKVRFLNCGVPGYGLGEFPAWLRRVQETYRPSDVVYVMNPNDFVLRDTLYEGADNGLYRQYKAPIIKTPWVVRKAIYRLQKGGVSPSTRWYRWTFEGTKSRDLERIVEMDAACRASGAQLRVVFLPVRFSFDAADRTIPDIYREVGEFLTARKIAWTDPTAAFASAGAKGGEAGDALVDRTDHLTPEGCRVMAAAIAEALGMKVE